MTGNEIAEGKAPDAITETQIQQRLSSHQLAVKDFSTTTYSDAPIGTPS